MSKKTFRSIEEVYYHLYVSKIDTVRGREQHEKKITEYLEQGYTQYDAMNSLVLNDQRVTKRNDQTYELIE